MAGPGLANGLDPWAEPPDPRERRAWRGRGARAWGAWMLLALASGLVADPAFSLPVACVLSGWEDARVGRWLKRSDPIRPRGRACSRFYLASGLWKVVLMAFALMCVVVMIQAAIEGPPENRSRETPPPSAFAGCAITWIVGFLIASAVSIVASLSAYRDRVRVWVGREAHWARADRAWPPQLARRRGRSENRAKLIVLAALISGALFLLILAGLVIGSLASRLGQSPGVVAIIIFVLIGVPALILVLLDRLTARMIAPTPSACWSLEVTPDRRGA